MKNDFNRNFRTNMALRRTPLPVRYFAVFMCVSLCACVPVSEEMLKGMAPSAQAVEAPYKGLEPGYKTYETAHFLIKAYSTETAVSYSVICEADYNRIMNDVGLYSFAPAKPYNIVVYKDLAEFMSKTGQPKWSGGVAYGNAILIYESEGSAAVLAHEMTHLIFNEFMGLANSGGLKWINEGLAVYEETQASWQSKADYSRRLSSLVAPNPIPFSQMINLAPQGEKDAVVERWYAQCGSVVAFMIKEGGTLGFSIFISRIKDGATVDAAAAEAFTVLGRNLSDIEKAWLLYIKS
ncbi:MAG: hypothetical protein KKH28_04235 [Elusimicrobia bacterium]|nr:hypothetical protein [Elusimicrobiota bacterium]